MYQLMANGMVRRLQDGATIPNDSANHDWIEYQAWLAKGNTPTLVAAPTSADIEARLQTEMDKAAQARGYDDIRAAISYRGSSNPTWAHEADVFFAWRDAVWAKAIDVLAQVSAGKADIPTPDQAVAMMPALVI